MQADEDKNRGRKTKPLIKSKESPGSKRARKPHDGLRKSHKRKRKSPRLAPTSGLAPELIFNRELSWLEFNARVLEEALDTHLPLLERVKFLAIHASNLDEFFMIRVSGLRRLMVSGSPELSPDDMTPSKQLDAIRRNLMVQLSRAFACWNEDILPKLRDAGINIVHIADLPPHESQALREYFETDIFPILTPLAFDSGHPFPHISNLSLNLAVLVKDPQHDEYFARVKVPDNLPRFVSVAAVPPEHPEDELALIKPNQMTFVWLEDVIITNLDLLFPGMQVVTAHPFRITRDADLELEEDEASDLLATIAESLELREFGSGVRLEVDKSMPPRIRELLISNLGIPSYLVYSVENQVGMADLMQLTQYDHPKLKDPAFVPRIPAVFAPGSDIFATVRRQDLLLYHPYDSFNPVVEFIREASYDPHVLAIKQTLYRIGPNSPIVDALLEARDNDKQVAVLVELKARFDEENNITWARKLEQEGVHVVYGLLGLKTHAKLCLVVRREPDGLVRYIHMSTGNYNPITARVYTDFGLFTADPAIGADVSDLFNALTGYSNKKVYRKLLVAPGTMRQEIISRIDREIEQHRKHGNGLLAFKMNALIDPVCIDALYKASQAGVKVDLQIRSMCCLRPELPGVSESIRVTSVVGRFLEHSRIFYFHNGGDEEIFLGSADLMPRNLDRRVEVLFPVSDPGIKQTLLATLNIHLQDNQKCWRLFPDGHYERLSPKANELLLNSQDWLLKNWGKHK